MSHIHIKTAFEYIKRSPFQAFAAIFVLTLTFFVATTLIILTYSSSQVLHYFETRPRAIAFMKLDASEGDISALQDKLGRDQRIIDIEFVTKERALEIFKEISENPLITDLVNPSALPPSLEFSLMDLSDAEQVIDEVRREAVVDEVRFTATLRGESEISTVINRLKTVTNYIRIGGGVFTGILIVSSFLTLMVIVSMRISARKGEIEILDLIGATPGFIRSPILLEALIYSVIGVFLGWILTFIIVVYSTPSVLGYFGAIPVLPKDAGDVMILFSIILGVELLVGIILAVIGTFVAASPSRK